MTEITEPNVVKVRRRNKSDLGKNYVAPDGGWGWVVCIAAGVSHLVVLPGLTKFGLIYRKNLTELNISSTEISAIFNTGFALSALPGLFNGPLFCKFTFREVGLAASALVSIGLLLSAWSTSFIQYMVTYGILYGIGLGLTEISGSLALNTYFKEKRIKATAFAFSLAAVGSIGFPYVAVWALSEFGYIGTVITFTGISLLSFISVICYRPALQFSKNIQIIEKDKNQTEDLLDKNATETSTLENIKTFIKELDLKLLKDKHFLNLLIGMTIIIFGQINFFGLVPFILAEIGLSDRQISLTMSISAGVDVIVRLLASFVVQKLPFGNKFLFAFGITLVSIGRLIVSVSNNFRVIIVAFILLGFGRAFREITRPLIIADYVPLKRLPAAYGLQLASTAIFSLSAGPVLGLIKQNWGFEITIHVINITSMLCLLSWGIEELVQKQNSAKSDFSKNENP